MKKYNQKKGIRYRIKVLLSIISILYLSTYLILRCTCSRAELVLNNEGDNLIFGSFFDADNSFEKIICYLYCPLGILDNFITGHKYRFSLNWYSLNSNRVKAYLADKKNKNNKAFYHITFDDGTKSSGFLGYLKEPYTIIPLIAKKYNIKGKSGFCKVEIESITDLEGKTMTTHEIEFKNGIIDGQYIISCQGKKISMITYKNGIRDGKLIFWINDKEILKGQFEKDKHSGEWISMYIIMDGVFCKVNFEDGKLNGLVEVFDADGESIANGVYKNDIPHNGTFIKPIRYILFSAAFYRSQKVELIKCKSGKLICSKQITLEAN